MIRNLAFLFILIFFHISAYSQIEISGVFPGAENHELIIHGSADLVSNRQKILATEMINDTAGFSLDLPLKHRMPLTIEVGYYTFRFIAVPARHYVFFSDTLKLQDIYRPFYNKMLLPCRMSESPGPEINQEIGAFDSKFNDFILANFGGIYQKRNIGIFRQIKEEMNRKADSMGNPFLKSYVDYKIASAEWAIAPQKKAWFFNTYIKDKPILYHNPEYIQFINSYFQDIPGLNNHFVHRDDLINGINHAEHYSALLDSLGKDSLLRNEQLRELVLLNTLKTLFGQPAYSTFRMNSFLDQIHRESKFEQHRIIAENLKFELNDLRKGSDAKNFKLQSLSGDSLELEQLRGQPVYIGFFTTWSYACLAELEGMQKLVDSYGERVHFISIILDQKQDVARKLIAEKNYSWPFLFNGTQYALLADYRVKTFPSFILLNDRLQIVQYPAYKPSEVIEGEIKKLLKPSSPANSH